MRALLLLLALGGCATLQKPETLAACAAADVGVTLAGVRAGLIKEANPLWASSVNAGHPAAFILATVAGVLFVNWLDKPNVTAAVSGTLCAAAGRNLWLMR